MKTIIDAKQDINATIAIFKVKGYGEITVQDNGTDVFPTNIYVNCNYGTKTVTKDLSGNASFDEKVSVVKVHADITNWNCTPTHLSFNIRIKAGKKELINMNLAGDR